MSLSLHDIDLLVKEFTDELGIKVGRCDLDSGDCISVSNVLVDWLEDRGLQPKLLHVTGLRGRLGSKATEFSRRYRYGGLFHAVVEVDGWVIDLTGDQFGRSFARAVYPLAELKRRWKNVERGPRDDRFVNNMRRLLLIGELEEELNEGLCDKWVSLAWISSSGEIHRLEPGELHEHFAARWLSANANESGWHSDEYDNPAEELMRRGWIRVQSPTALEMAYYDTGIMEKALASACELIVECANGHVITHEIKRADGDPESVVVHVFLFDEPHAVEVPLPRFLERWGGRRIVDEFFGKLLPVPRRESKMLTSALREWRAENDCDLSESFAWIEPDGKVHRLNEHLDDHASFARRFLSAKIHDEFEAYIELLRRGWVRAVNSLTIELVGPLEPCPALEAFCETLVGCSSGKHFQREMNYMDGVENMQVRANVIDDIEKYIDTGGKLKEIYLVDFLDMYGPPHISERLFATLLNPINKSSSATRTLGLLESSNFPPPPGWERRGPCDRYGSVGWIGPKGEFIECGEFDVHADVAAEYMSTHRDEFPDYHGGDDDEVLTQFMLGGWIRYQNALTIQLSELSLVKPAALLAVCDKIVECVNGKVIRQALEKAKGDPESIKMWIFTGEEDDISFSVPDFLQRFGGSKHVDRFFKALTPSTPGGLHESIRVETGQSPLEYGRSPRSERISLVDPYASPAGPSDPYFAKTWRTVRYGRSGLPLKRPRREQLPGSPPGTVAFLDFHVLPDGNVYVDYILTRNDNRGMGHATWLVNELIRRFGNDVEYDFGDVVSPYAEKIVRALKIRGHSVRMRSR